MRTRRAREIRRGLHYGSNWAKQMYEIKDPSVRSFLMECLDDWARRASDTANRAAARAIRAVRTRRS